MDSQVAIQRDEATTTGSGGLDAFISYSHAADGLMAPRLQAALQRFAKPWWKRRAMRVFRDESSLSANPHLWSSITEALDSAEWFVLLLSPDAAESQWVNREVEYWLEHRDPNRILPVLTEGAFVWDEASEAVDPISSVPPALVGAFSEEPRWVDLRWARDETQLDLRDSRFRGAVADVASAIRDVPKDDLESEEVRQHRRTVRTAWAAGVALAVLAVLAGLAAVYANGQRREAEARGLAARAVSLTPTRLDLGLLLAVEGFRTSDNLETRDALLHALNGAQHLVGSVDEVAGAEYLAGADGKAVVHDGEQITVRDENWDVVGEPISFDGLPWLFVSPDASRVAAPSSEGAILIWEVETGQQIGVPLLVPGAEDVTAQATFSPDGRLIAISVIQPGPFEVFLFDVETGEETVHLTIETESDAWGTHVFTPDGERILVARDDTMSVFDVSTGELVTEATVPLTDLLATSPDGSLVAAVSQIPPEVNLLDGATLEQVLPTLRPTSGGRIISFEFSLDGSMLAVQGDDASVTVFDTATGTVIDDLKAPTGAATGVAWLGQRVAIGTDTLVTEWDLAQPSALATKTESESYFSFPGVATVEGALATSAEGSFQYRIDGEDRTIELPAECSRIEPFHDRRAVVLGCSDGETGSLVVADLQSGDLETLAEMAHGFYISLSPDDRYLAVLPTGAGSVMVIDADDGNVVMPELVLDGWALVAAEWDPDTGRLFVGGQDGEVIVIDTARWEESGRLVVEPAKFAISDFDLHPDGRTLYASTEAGRVWAVDIDAMEILGEPLTASGTQLQEMALSPDGTMVMATSRDGSIRIWETQRSLPVGPALRGHPEGAFRAAWGPDGPISIGFEGVSDDGLYTFSTMEWDLDLTNGTQVACDLVGRNLTQQEWSAYVPDRPYRATCPDFPAGE